MNIRIAETDEDIAACFTVMRELRPHVAENEFVPRVQAQRRQGYHLALLQIEETPVAVAGFRISENLAWGRYLYIDDLVTLSEYRSKGAGAALLRWLEERAINEACKQIHLDTGLQREDALRFYKREEMQVTGYHLAKNVSR